MKTWYNITAKDNGAAEISIYDEIGMWGVTAKAFINDLQKLGDVKNITLSVNSPGGSVFDGLAIYNALKNTRDKGATITAKVMGIAASAASFIVMAANTIEMPENSMMMVHYASGLAWGNAETMRDTADILDKIDASIVGIYTARTGKDEATVRDLLKAETYMTAKEAKDNGFADTVTENVKATAKFDLENLPENIRNLFKSSDPRAAVNADENAEVALSADGKILVVSDDEGVTTYDWVVVEGAGSWVARPFVLADDDEEEEDDSASPFADQINAAAKKAGFAAHAAFFALNYENMEAASAAIEQAREIKALCAVAKKEALLDGFITAKKSVADVRVALQNALATDAGREVNNHQPSNESQPSNEQPAAGLKHADVWAARRKQLTNRKGA